MKQAKLIISPDGNSVHIQFANGKVSIDFESEEEAFYNVLECQIYDKITEEESDKFLKEISLAVEKKILFQSKIKYESPNGFHRHKCNNCGHVWEHDDSCVNKINLHKCPQCKEVQWNKYFGLKAPTSIVSKN